MYNHTGETCITKYSEIEVAYIIINVYTFYDTTSQEDELNDL